MIIDSIINNAFSYGFQLILMAIVLWYFHMQVENIKTDAVKQIAEAEASIIMKVDSVAEKFDTTFDMINNIKDKTIEKASDIKDKTQEKGSTVFNNLKKESEE